MLRVIPGLSALVKITGIFPALPALPAILALGALGLQAQPAAPIRWATVGNSITQHSGYPAKLQKLLGPAFLVENEGVSGTTLLKKGNLPYWTKGKFPQLFAFKPQIVTVKLGTNDSKPYNWSAHKGEFLGDLRAMADTLAGMPTRPLTFLCYPVPAFRKNGQWSVDGINDPVIKDEIMPLIRQVAVEKELGLIDLHKPLENRGDLFANDGVHPDADKAGADSIASLIYRAFHAGATRIACIGNSITDHGHGAEAYPIKLNQLLGREYLVLNAGHSGRTLLRKGDNPYYQSPWFAEVFRFQPHIVTIKLGTNDSKPHNWDSRKDEFAPDLRWLIDTLRTMPTKPRIVLLTPIPAWRKSDGTEAYGIRGAVIKDEIVPKVKQVAREKGLAVVDLHTAFQPYQNLVPDGVHPDAAGLDTLAHILYRAWKELPVGILEPSRPDGRGRGRSRGRQGAFSANPLAPLGLDARGRVISGVEPE